MADKIFYTQDNIGTVKYVVNHHDGVKKHPDGSPFYDIHTFKNKKKLSKFLTGLKKAGYVEKL